MALEKIEPKENFSDPLFVWVNWDGDHNNLPGLDEIVLEGEPNGNTLVMVWQNPPVEPGSYQDGSVSSTVSLVKAAAHRLSLRHVLVLVRPSDYDLVERIFPYFEEFAYLNLPGKIGRVPQDPFLSMLAREGMTILDVAKNDQPYVWGIIRL